MKMRMAIATFALVVGASALTACTGDEPVVTEPTASSTTTAPTAPATISVAADLVGDWEDPDAEWTVHFKDDLTFIEDFKGVEGFRVGEYTLEGDEVTLKGGDGNPDKGKVEDQKLVFNLGTLTRK